jgi:hypothetical protein
MKGESNGAGMEAEEDAKPRRILTFNSMEIAHQVNTVRDWLSHGKRPHQIRKLCADEWGLSYRTAENRIAMARREAVKDLDQLDRKELAAQAIETLLKVQEQSLDTRQGSNAIGATRLMLELAGILGRSA